MDNSYMDKAGINNGAQEFCDNIVNDFIREIVAILDSIELELVNIEVDPDNPVYLDAICQGFRTIKRLAGFLEGDIASEIVEYTGELLETCQKFNITITRSITNIFLQSILFLRKICNNRKILTDTKFQGEVGQHISNITQMKDGIMLDIKQPVKSPENRIGEILVEDGIIKQNDIEYVLEKQSSIYRNMKFGEIALRERKVDASGLIKAIRAQKIRNESSEQYVRIPIERIDQILEIVNRIETIQNNLHHETVLRFGSNDSLTTESRNVKDMLSDIQKILQELRLVTFKQSFQKLKRAVRAMIEEKGINVIISTIGENTEVNKEISDEIIIPLAKIIEFILDFLSTDHSREKIDEIKITAYKDSEYVMVEISCNKQIEPDLIHNSTKIKEAERKIESLKGRIEYKNAENIGLHFKIIIS
ncbi:MAG: hypothetical protein GX045_10230 [Clostridiaceae bacterium]|nr:hypothetical protein [Clostridiaceae bacterium]